jgi:hypothetical protein
MQMQLFFPVFIYQDPDSAVLFRAATEFVERNPSLSVKVGKVHEFFANGTEPVKLTKECGWHNFLISM